MEGAGRRIPRDTELGDLPSSVVETIVSFMSISDAVRAAMVGNDWREGWKFIKDLDFDKPFFDDFIAGTNYQLDAVVNSIMSRHAGQVTSFNSCIPEDIPDDVPVDISEVISILSQKEVEYLTVNVFRNVYLELPSAMYSCSRLVKLELEGCQLGSAPHFNGFPVLTCLRLADVVVDDDVLNSMISHSPQLHQLDLEFWVDGNPVEFHHAAPENLESVYYQCKEGCRRPLRLSGFPNLTHAAFETELQFPFVLELQFTGLQWRSCRLEHLANLIPQVQELSLNDLAITSIAYGAVPVFPASRLTRLVDLELHLLDIASDQMLSVAFGLIRSAPNLRSLGIQIDQDDVNPAAAFMYLDQQLRLQRPLRTISTLSFENLIRSDLEFEFIETMILLCPRVETIHIKAFEFIERADERKLHRTLRCKIRLPTGASFNFERVDRQA